MKLTPSTMYPESKTKKATPDSSSECTVSSDLAHITARVTRLEAILERLIVIDNKYNPVSEEQ